MHNREFTINDNPLHQAIDRHYRQDETQCIEEILTQAEIPVDLMQKIEQRATQLVEKVRTSRRHTRGIDALLFQYDLASDEGIALMCLAEALLRIPDKETVDALIRDKLSVGNWQSHLGKSPSLFVNAATWGLMLTGKILQSDDPDSKRVQYEQSLTKALKRLISKGGEPIVRQAIGQIMKILGRQFVMGRTIQGALKRSRNQEKKGYRYSYDMLGEAAFTAEDAQNYFMAYCQAIDAVGQAASGKGPIAGPGISVKLSALHPRFILAKKERLKKELLPRIIELIQRAKAFNIGLTIDAEEAHTLGINLELIEAILASDVLEKWQGFGLAVQAYQKRAPAVLDLLIELARKQQKKIMIRLVKGAYWDTEIKLAQIHGLSCYPVFTRKIATDVNYIVCVKKLLAASDVVYPQFATHNALTLATVMELAKAQQISDYEFQCLHGMGRPLYDQIVDSHQGRACRIYAPVGSHKELLAYLVRRLLENGANSSFVNHVADERRAIAEIIRDPVKTLNTLSQKAHPHIPLPLDLFQPLRPNSLGVDFTHPAEFMPLLQQIETLAKTTHLVQLSQDRILEKVKCYSPIDNQHFLGEIQLADEQFILQALAFAEQAVHQWQQTDVEQRASALERMAILLKQEQALFLSLLVYEAGKTLDDAMSELREAIDYCYYYAAQARKLFAIPQDLTGPTGELNQLRLHGRGIIGCISPWNFPLAIFLGQVTASLAAGNCVIAKPAMQTVIIAAKAIDLMHQAGIPQAVVQLLPAKGSLVSEVLIPDARIKGIVFTGSTATAQSINRTLSARDGAIIPLIAETGGQNAMIVDSSALPEQVVQDVITSAFRSAGQRCSALRVLFLQEDIAEKTLTMLKGAMDEQKIDHPVALSTDIGPVIDEQAKSTLLKHVKQMEQKATLLYKCILTTECEKGSFVAPHLFEISSLDELKEEVFGPILHVVRYPRESLPEVLAQINRTGYGLTLGIHSRIDETIRYICKNVQVGNIYVNRSMIGAVVGVQPFGGDNLSGTGPKAGGPFYLARLATEQTLTINTTASGGNASLLALTAEDYTQSTSRCEAMKKRHSTQWGIIKGENRDSLP